MRGLLTASAFLALAACGQPPTTDQPAAPAPTESKAEATPAPVAAVEGWQVGAAAYSLMGSTLPPISGEKMYGEAFSSASLRDRWTILGVWADGTPPAEEATYAAALASAADQDPDLDVLILYTAADAAPGNSVWPRTTVSEAMIAALDLPETPAYLLIGPDLTIEGYRGALSATPEDGVKPVFRGVHEIRKQIAAPH